MEKAEKKSVLPKEIVSFSIVADGFMSGFLPGFRVVTVRTGADGRSRVESSSQKYLLAEAEAMVEDKLKEYLRL